MFSSACPLPLRERSKIKLRVLGVVNGALTGVFTFNLSGNMQANSGAACSVAHSKPDGQKKCQHTLVVGLGVLGDHFKNSMGVDGGGNGEGGRSVEVGTGRAEWNAGGERKTSFSRKMKQLMKIIGVLRFPVNPKHHLSARARQILVGGSDIPCHENVCAACLRDYVVLGRQEAIAVRQVRHSPLVATASFFFVVCSGHLIGWTAVRSRLIGSRGTHTSSAKDLRTSKIVCQFVLMFQPQEPQNISKGTDVQQIGGYFCANSLSCEGCLRVRIDQN